MQSLDEALDGRTIVRAEFVSRSIPLRQPLRGHRGPVAARVVRTLMLEADGGVRGAGEASRVDWLSPCAVESGRDSIADVVEAIRETAPPARSLLASTMRRRMRREENAASSPLQRTLSASSNAVRSAVQTALLDIAARERRASVAALLGAKPATRLPVSALLAERDPDEMAAEAAALRTAGFSCFKVKVGACDLALDVARVRAVRSAIGPTGALRLDANGAWTLREAARALDALSVFEPALVEEPLRRGEDRRALGTTVPVALDESVSTPEDLERELSCGAFRALVLKLERVGGPLAALEIAALAARAGIDVLLTDSIEGEVGRAATVHTAAAIMSSSDDAAGADARRHAVGLGGMFLLADGGVPARAVEVGGAGLGVIVAR